MSGEVLLGFWGWAVGAYAAVGVSFGGVVEISESSKVAENDSCSW